MKLTYPRATVGMLLVCALIAGRDARATNGTDIKISLKTLPLLTNKLSGTVPMLVVFDPANGASKAEADAVVAAVGGGMDAGGVSVTATAVAFGSLASTGGSKLVFVTAGLSGNWEAIGKAAGGALTLTTDLACVKADKCIIGVVSEPSVSIYYSKAAADAGNVGFSDAFSMLAKKF